MLPAALLLRAEEPCNSQLWLPPSTRRPASHRSFSSTGWTRPSPPRCASASASSTYTPPANPSRPSSPPRPTPARHRRHGRCLHTRRRCVPSLRCVISTAVGVDHIDLPECARRGVVVANQLREGPLRRRRRTRRRHADRRAPARIGGGAVRPAWALASPGAYPLGSKLLKHG